MKKLPLLLFFTLIANGCYLTNNQQPSLPQGAEKAPILEHLREEGAEDSNQDLTEEPTNLSAIEALGEPKQTAVFPGQTAVQIVFREPVDKVDYFIVRYGFNKEDLELIKVFKIEDLQSVNDPKLGTILIGQLTNIPTKSSLFVTVQAKSNNLLSAESEIYEMPPMEMEE